VRSGRSSSARARSQRTRRPRKQPARRRGKRPAPPATRRGPGLPVREAGHWGSLLRNAGRQKSWPPLQKEPSRWLPCSS